MQLKNESKIQLNNLCFCYEKFRDLIEDSEIRDRSYFLNVESMTLWVGTKKLDHIFIEVIRDHLDIFTLIEQVWGTTKVICWGQLNGN